MDKTKLKEILKEEGLDLAEDTVALAVKAVFNALPKIAKETENTVDDALVGIIEVLKPTVYAWVDKIDGEEG